LFKSLSEKDQRVKIPTLKKIVLPGASDFTGSAIMDGAFYFFTLKIHASA
jgi:hypothetical protein